MLQAAGNVVATRAAEQPAAIAPARVQAEHQRTLPEMLAQVELQHAADEPREQAQQPAEPLAEADEDAEPDKDAEAVRTVSMSFLGALLTLGTVLHSSAVCDLLSRA